MNELQIILQEPKLPTDWNYNESVKRMKVFVYKWKNLTGEMMNELWIAREMLAPAAEKAGTKVPRSWSNYCKDIGSSRQVVNRWIANFFNHKKEIDEYEEDGIDYEVLPNGLTLINDDFRSTNVEDNSIDLILTDPQI